MAAGRRYRLSPLSIRETTTGAVIASATVTVYLAGTTTAATCYADTTTGTPLASSQTTTSASGYFEFFIDNADYASTQRFKLVISKTGYTDVTYDNLPILPVTVFEVGTLANTATPAVTTASKYWLTGGTTTITNITGGVTGQEIVILSEHAITITDGTNLFLNGSTNFVMASTDSLTLVCKADGKWYETGRSDNT